MRAVKLYQFVSLAISLVLMYGTSPWALASKCCQPTYGKLKDEASPTFAPGAEVTVFLRVELPKGYELGGDPSLAVHLDKKVLKRLGISASQFNFSFSDKELSFQKSQDEAAESALSSKNTAGAGQADELERIKPASITFVLSEKVKKGRIELPLKLELFFCSEAGGFCSRAELARSIGFSVGSGKDALMSGELKLCIKPSLQELFPETA